MSEIINNVSLASEITKLIEAGINKQINSSILYSPFKIAFNYFKKSNPSTINQVRLFFTEEVEQKLANIAGYNEEIFFYDGGFSKKGQSLRKLVYNIGIRLMKNEINVRTAFAALRNQSVREEIFNYLMENIEKSVIMIITNEYIDN